MHALRFGLVIAAALLAAACLPVTSKVPIGTTVGLSADPALIGTWKVIPEKKKGPDGKDDNTSDGGPGYIHFLVASDGTMTALTISTGKAGPEKAEGDWSVFATGAAALGAYHYLNVRETFENGEPAKDKDAMNVPLLYKLDRGGRLTLYLIGEKAAKDAIAAGKIEGTVEQGDFGDAAITAPADKLDTFFASKDGAALFSEKLVTLKRVR